jgi:hypothetical protein
MVRIDGEIVIERPADGVFDFVADARNEPRYNPMMRRVEQISEGPIGVGTRFRAETVRMGRPVDMVIEFTRFERPRRIEESAHMSSMELHGALTFEPLPEGTLMRWAWDVRPRGVLKMMGPLVARMGRRQERAVSRGLKALLEADAGLPIHRCMRGAVRGYPLRKQATQRTPIDPIMWRSAMVLRKTVWPGGRYPCSRCDALA